MKKLLALLLAPALLSLSAVAQLSGSDSGSKEKTKIKTKSGDTRSWAAKWNPESLAFGKISLSGEYSLKRKKSITFGIGIPVDGHFSSDPSDYRVDFNTRSFSVMGGYRLYLGKRTMRGIYLEPFLKYVDMKASGQYDNKSVIDHDIYDTHITYSGVGAGVQLGVQFQVARVLVLDLFLLGPEANIARFEGNFREVLSTGPWSQAQVDKGRQEIQKILDDIPIVGDKTEVTIYANERRVNARYHGFLPGLRAGLSVGVRF